MTIWMRNLAVFAMAISLAAFTAGCEDDDGGGGGGGQPGVCVGGVNNGQPCTTGADCPGGACQGGVGGTTTTTTSTTMDPGSTTTTTLASTTTTTVTTVTVTTTSTTTTTVGSFSCDCAVTFNVPESETLGSLQYDTDYSGAQPGGFEGSAGAVNCTATPGGFSFASFNDVEGTTTLSSAMISATGFTGPGDVATCNYETNNAALAAGDFGVTVTDQAAPDFSPTSATVVISDITCDCGTGSTTTSSTVTSSTSSTTVGGPTTTTTTTTGPTGANDYDIEFSVDGTETLGALQFTAGYGGAPGAFQGSADSVSCTSPLSATGAFVTFNDDEGTTTLNFAAVALAGFTAPTVVANCTFNGSGTAPVAGDFTVTVVDASDPGLSPISPLPGVNITNITLL